MSLKFIVILLAATLCVDCKQSLPSWFIDNYSLVKSSIEGTVLVDCKLTGDIHHRGGVGIVLDTKHVFIPAHVVENCELITVHTRMFREDIAGIQVLDKINGKIIERNALQDAALFETTTDITVRPMAIDANHISIVNEHIWYFGKSNAVRFGNISNVSSVAGPMTNVIQVIIDARNGDSGAPLITDDARVIGFLYATSLDSERTYFIPIGRALKSVNWN